MPKWTCFGIWGGIVLIGALCQAAESLWPGQKEGPAESAHRQAVVQASETSGFLPPPMDASPRRSVLPADASNNQRPLPSEQLQRNPTSPDAVVSAKQPEASSGPNAGGGLPSGSSEEGGHSSGSASERPEPIRLGPAAKSPPLSGVPGRPFDPAASTLTVLSSLAVVLGAFLLLVWAIRRAMPRSAQILPTEVVEILGRAPLMGKQQMYLLRCGPKLLLVSVTPEGAETLTEIEHPDEVARITALCRQGQPGSIPGAFRQILDQMARPKPAQRWFRRTAEPLEDSVAGEASLQEESARV